VCVYVWVCVCVCVWVCVRPSLAAVTSENKFDPLAVVFSMSVRSAVPNIIKISLQNQEVFLYVQPYKKRARFLIMFFFIGATRWQ